MGRPRVRVVLRVVVTVAGVALVAGCGNPPAYVMLQDTMKKDITREDHRPVESVACRPHVQDTVREEAVRLRCVVRFKDGSGYTARAVIQNENFGGAHGLPDRYTWDRPPPRR
jgi:hypothetical protein